MTLLAYLMTAVAIVLIVPCLVLLVQVLAAVIPMPFSKPLIQTTDREVPIKVCVLMPAHNEANGIGPVVQALLPQLTDRIKLLVVADNCTDETAAIVRDIAALSGSKVSVVERHNTLLRGKGYALDHGVQLLKSDPPNVVLVVDADCTVEPGGIASLAQQCFVAQRPVQALYLMDSPPGASVKTLVAEFAWIVKNQVRPKGYHRLGLPCQLMGTGMAFTWEQISKAKLNTGHIAEDMQLGVELARAGSPPQFSPNVLVSSFFPTGIDGLQTQRTRWEHGHLSVILAEVPRLLFKAIARFDFKLFAMVLDLCVPPLALLVLLVTGLFVGSGALALTVGLQVALWPLLLSVVALCLLGAAVLLAWVVFGRAVISFRQLCTVPVYVCTKIPLYFYFLVKRQASWVRSKREGE